MNRNRIAQWFLVALLVVGAGVAAFSSAPNARSWLDDGFGEGEFCPSPNYGLSCQSSPNSCGQLGTGTYDCYGYCSAVTPSESQCPPPTYSQANYYSQATYQSGYYSEAAYYSQGSYAPEQCTWEVCSLDQPGDGFTTYCDHTFVRELPPGCSATHQVCDVIHTSGPSCASNPPPPPPPPVYQCGDGVDNDSDGLTDLADSGCSSGTDNNEYNPPVTQCGDGVDNDGDGLTDLSDPGCSSEGDTNEYNTPPPPSSTQCGDGVDNDGDGLTDLSDPGCSGAGDNEEYNAPASPPSYQCSDGVDNDGDGASDYPTDVGCTSALDNDEYNPPSPPAPDASLSLTAPSLVQPNSTVSLAWSVTSVQSSPTSARCDISGTNGQVWSNINDTSSDSGSVVSNPIQSETTFTLVCTDLDGDTVSAGFTVRMAPSFEEI